MSINYERLASLTASGLSDAQISTIIGVSPSRISQIKKEEAFIEALTAKQAELATKDIEELSLSAKYNAAEYLLLDQLTQLASVAEFRDVTAALRVIAERQERAKTRVNPVMQGSPVYNNVIQLTLPSHAVPEVFLNSNKEVIAIGQKNLAPLSSTGVLDLFKELSPKKELPAEGSHHELPNLPRYTEENAAEAVSFLVENKVSVK